MHMCFLQGDIGHNEDVYRAPKLQCTNTWQISCPNIALRTHCTDGCELLIQFDYMQQESQEFFQCCKSQNKNVQLCVFECLSHSPVILFVPNV